MARRSVRIDIPVGNPEQYVKLIESIWKQHIALGASSPLYNNPLADMASFEALKNEAVAKREQAIEHLAQAHALMAQSRELLGVSPGQTSTTPGTLYYHVVCIKKLLTVKYRDVEQNLEQFGFNVVTKTAKKPIRKKKDPEV